MYVARDYTDLKKTDGIDRQAVVRQGDKLMVCDKTGELKRKYICF